MSVLFTKDQIISILKKSQTVKGIKEGFDSSQKIAASRYDSLKLWISVKNFSKSTFDTYLKETYPGKRSVPYEKDKLEKFLANPKRTEIWFDSSEEPSAKKRKRDPNLSYEETSEDQSESPLTLQEKFERLVKEHERLKLKHAETVQENIRLNESNKSLEQKLAFQKNKNSEISEFLSRSSSTGGLGKPHESMLQYIMKGILKAETAPSLFHSLTNLKKTLPNTFGDAQIFSESSIRRMRALTPQVQKSFLDHYLDQSDTIILSHDSSPSSDMIDILGVTFKNQKNHSILVCAFPCPDKSAEKMADEIFLNLQKIFENRFCELISKISCFLSDRAPNALKTSKILYQKCFEIWPKPRLYSSCFLHILMHFESLSVKACNTIPGNDFRNFLNNIAAVFGRRLKSGYSHENISEDLDFSSEAKIQSSVGSRYHCDIENCRQLINFHNDILNKSRPNSENNKRAKQITEALSKNLDLTLVSACLVSALWSCIGSPLSKKISQLITVNDARNIFEDLLHTTELFLNSNIRGIVEKIELIEKNPKALKAISFLGENFDTMPVEIQIKAKNITKKIGEFISSKIKNDSIEIFSSAFAYPENDLLSLSNQDCERSFGFFKQIDHKFLHGSVYTQIMLTCSRFNKLDDYCAQINISAIMPKNLKDSYKEYCKKANLIEKIYKQERQKKREGIYLRQDSRDKLMEIFSADLTIRDSKLSDLSKITSSCVEKLPQGLRIYGKQIFKQQFVFFLTGIYHKTAAQAFNHLECLLE